MEKTNASQVVPSSGDNVAISLFFIGDFGRGDVSES